ncbi:MAG: hypothetical protein ACRDRG_05170 [Pseudonocardiaceae bacterium]
MLVVGILLAIKPEIITGTLETTGAMVRVGALLLGWLLFSFLIRRFARPPVLRTGLIMVAGSALLALTVWPYFIDTRANDALLTGPVGVSTPDPSGPVGVDTPDSSGTASAGTQGSPGPAGAGTQDPPGRAGAGTQDSPGPTGVGTQGAPRGEPSQATAARVTSGRLKGLAGHRGSGTASIVRTSNGSHVVQLEDYDVSSGITLFLYVVPGANQERPRAGGVNLGRLAENTGNRVVSIPEGHRSVRPADRADLV